MATGEGVVVDHGGRVEAPVRTRTIRQAGYVVVALALASVTTTFLILTGLTPIAPDKPVIITCLVVNGTLVAVLLGLVAFEMGQLLRARTLGSAGARLHVRILALFSLMAVLPAALVAVVATITLSRGLDRWFEDRTAAIVSNSVAVADAYVEEHARVLQSDIIAMANDIDRAKQLYDFEPGRFDAFLKAQTSIRGLPAAFLLRRNGDVVTSALRLPDLELRMPPQAALAGAEAGDPVLIAPGDADQVGGILKLKAYDDLFLYIARPMDSRVVNAARLTAANAQEYHTLSDSRLGTQVAFGFVYAGVTLVLLVSALWVGFGFANRLVTPIRDLIAATDRVAGGDLKTKVASNPNDGDLGHLGATFNKMTAQLRQQREDLISASEQIDKRRRFTETVLAGVTAGVLGVDHMRRISLANRSARALLNVKREAELVGRSVDAVVPEIAQLIGDTGGQRSRQDQITLHRGPSERTVSVRVTTDGADPRTPGFVVTLDDITDLVTAQRTSAWADVARRIAHEIKNPLTPIQLSAERIKRRYGKRIEDDREVFDQCIDTIVRQVGDIGRMVNEFSAFARMPKPVFERKDLREAAREAVFLQSVGNPELVVETHFPDEPVIADFDQRLLGQALGNLVKNAAESIEQTTAEDRGGNKGHIDVSVACAPNGEVFAEVVDNGIGLPAEDRQRLLEPYMTTREKGTGLGLAIVTKIAEEHGGRIELLDAAAVGRTHRGACVRLFLPEPVAGRIPEAASPSPT